MKRTAIFALAAVLAAPRIFPVDFGAILSTNADLKFDRNVYDQASFEQSETLAPYVKVHFGETAYLASEILVKHRLRDVFGDDEDAENDFILDLTLLKLNKVFMFGDASSLELAAGRMFTVDSTGMILSQTNDGVSLKFNSQSLVVGGYFGYSGLQNIKDVEIISSAGNQFVLKDENDVYDFAAPYLIGSLSVSAPYLFAKQTLSLETLGVFPASGPNELPDDEDNRIYGTLALNGPIMPALFYKASVTMETFDFSQIAMLTNIGLDYYTSFKDLAFGISAVYASGGKGALDPFVGFTKKRACLSADEPSYSGLLKTGLSASIVPLKRLFVSLGTDIVFDMTEDSGFYGWQISGAARWNVFSDLQVSLGASTFVGDDEDSNRTEFTLGAALAF